MIKKQKSLIDMTEKEFDRAMIEFKKKADRTNLIINIFFLIINSLVLIYTFCHVYK